MFNRTVFQVKDPEEVLDLTFDETERLNGANIVVGSTYVTIVSSSGDPSREMLVGNSTVSGALVTQRVTGGVPCTYALRLAFDTDDGRHLVEVGLLPVRVLGYVALDPDPTPYQNPS